MAINVAIFVPSGIILGSEDLGTVNTAEQISSACSVQGTFALGERYAMSFIGNNFIEGLPCESYVEKIRWHSRYQEFTSVEKLAEWLDAFWEQAKVPSPEYYLAGYDFNGKELIPSILLCQQQGKVRINFCGDAPTYNFHACGQTAWVNKMMLDTYYDPKEGEKIAMEAARIDFSKFDTAAAEEFALFLLRISCEMNRFSQKGNVPKSCTTVTISPSGISVKKQSIQ